MRRINNLLGEMLRELQLEAELTKSEVLVLRQAHAHAKGLFSVTIEVQTSGSTAGERQRAAAFSLTKRGLFQRVDTTQDSGVVRDPSGGTRRVRHFTTYTFRITPAGEKVIKGLA